MSRVSDDTVAVWVGTSISHARWVAAGSKVELAIYPGGMHGFTLFSNELLNLAQARMDEFLNRVLG
jgi:acetyl esterase/lipase